MLSHIQEENRKFKEHNAYLESINKRPFQRVGKTYFDYAFVDKKTNILLFF